MKTFMLLYSNIFKLPERTHFASKMQLVNAARHLYHYALADNNQWAGPWLKWFYFCSDTAVANVLLQLFRT